MEFQNPGPIELTDQELQVLIVAIHGMQDQYEDALFNLGQAENFAALHGGVLSDMDRAAQKGIQWQQDMLDVIRRKLGDKWEPAAEFRAPSDLSSL